MKKIEKKEYDGKFQENCKKTKWTTYALGIASMVGSIALEFACHPVAIDLLVLQCASFNAEFGSAALSGAKTVREYMSNREFNEQTVKDELNIYNDF